MKLPGSSPARTRPRADLWNARPIGSDTSKSVQTQNRRGSEKFQEERDPINLFRAAVLARGLVNESDLNAIDARVSALIDGAVTFAEESLYPDVKETFTDVYVNY
jgi:TPP-dependent pyruvate/acetoin dehydrogenase alpha subunit